MDLVLTEYSVQPAFKFEQSFRLTHFISLSFSGLVFVLIVAFTVSHLGRSTETLIYDGLLTQESANSSFFLAVLPVPETSHFSYVVFADISPSEPDAFYLLDVEMFCQWFDSPARRIHQTFPNSTGGRYRLFSTSLFTYKSLLIQIQISELSGRRLNGVRLVSIQTNPEFGGNALKTRIILSMMSAVLLICYLVVLFWFSPSSIRIQQVLTTVCLILSAIANFPITTVFRQIPMVVIDGIMCGVFCAFNLVSLLCFLQKSSTRTLRFVLAISALFLLAEIMLAITSDTNLLSQFFEDNTVIWIFFLSMTVISSVGYALLLIHSLMIAFCRSRSTRTTLFIAYGLATFIALLPLVGESMLFMVTGSGNFAIDFCSHYLAQTLLVFLFADLHWPLVISELGETLCDGHRLVLLPNIELGTA
jgi:hypothetical protein